ncbi:MAG: hypothetical protein K9W43_14065 [Candidatus Thorarchaeota archaeon]|nr:hypothetical protein [Candidatus Thorarchaeota archaeon]
MSSFKDLLEEAREKGYKLGVYTITGFEFRNKYVHHVGDDYVAISKQPDQMYDEVVLFAQIVSVNINRQP